MSYNLTEGGRLSLKKQTMSSTVETIPIQPPQSTEVVPLECSVEAPTAAKICWKSWFTYETYQLGAEMEDFIFYNVTLARDLEQLKAGSFFEQVCWNISQLRLLLYPETTSLKYYEAKLDFKLRSYRGARSDIQLDAISAEERKGTQNLLNFHGVNYHDFFHYLYEDHLPARKSNKVADDSYDFKFWMCRITYDIDPLIAKGMLFYQISWLPSCGTVIFYPMSQTGNIIVRHLTYAIYNVNELEDME